MAYVKTAFALSAASVALVQLINDKLLELLGWILLPVSLIVFLIGIYDYQRVKKSINEEKRDGGL
jgi:inner membrane protein YidH